MYKIKKRKLIFKNQVYKVYSNYIKSKTINIKDYLSIEVKGKVYGGVCCILIRKNKIGLMKAYSPLAQRNFYSLAQGFTDYKEDIKTAIKREVSEETGINLRKNNFKKICELYAVQSLINSKLAVFVAKLKDFDKNYSKNIVKEISVGKLNFFNIKTLKQMLKKPNKFDLVTYSTLCYYLFLTSK